MNVEIGAEATLFPEREYRNVIAVAVQGAANIVTRVSLADMLEHL
jgi:hypothetical protein